MKKSFSVLVLVLVVAVVFAACGGGGGGSAGSSGTAPANYTTPTAAAASASTAGSAAVTVESMAGVLQGFGAVSLPAGLAPRLAARGGMARTAKLDPQVKALFDKVASKSKSAMLQNALKTTNALKASRSVSINSTYSCGTSTVGGGSMKIVGSNNYDNTARTYDEATYTITFNACNDGVVEINGSLSLHGKFYLDNTSITISETMTNLTVYDLTYLDTVTLNASTGMTILMPDSDHFSETISANGYFADRADAGAEARFTFSGVSLKFTGEFDTVTGQETDKMAVNGGMRLSLNDNVGTLVFAYSITATNFIDKLLFLNDAADTMEEWTNGTIALSWTPVLGGCAPGAVTFTTPTATPITFTAASGPDPVSGRMMVNSATIDFATPTFPQITVTLANGASTIYANLAAFNAAGNSCSL